MTDEKRKFRRRKLFLTLFHIIFVAMSVFGISAMYLNSCLLYTSMGKTAFVLNVVDYVAVRKSLPCMVFSLEMSKEQLVNRMLSMESNVDSQKLRTGSLTDSDWDAVVEGIGVIGNSKLIIDCLLYTSRCV